MSALPRATRIQATTSSAQSTLMRLYACSKLVSSYLNVPSRLDTQSSVSRPVGTAFFIVAMGRHRTSRELSVLGLLLLLLPVSFAATANALASPHSLSDVSAALNTRTTATSSVSSSIQIAWNASLQVLRASVRGNSALNAKVDAFAVTMAAAIERNAPETELAALVDAFMATLERDPNYKGLATGIDAQVAATEQVIGANANATTDGASHSNSSDSTSPSASPSSSSRSALHSAMGLLLAVAVTSSVLVP